MDETAWRGREILICSDDGVRARSLTALCGSHRLACQVAGGAGQALELLRQCSRISLMLIAGALPDDADGLELLLSSRRLRPDVSVLVMSEHPRIETATEAIRRGAEDFVAIPYSPELLLKEIERVLHAADLEAKVSSLRQLAADEHGLELVASRAPSMLRPLELARAAARSDTPVLLVGETGTGKEMLARAIHFSSARGSHPFVPVNCAALPRDLLESELFGHRRGAFSGAVRDHRGLFLAANRGTIFLDEIGDLTPEAQPKLLRVLQDGEIRPVGGLDRLHVDARVIAATNRSLQEMRDGLMREDLFYRLSILVIELPPLRHRLEDLPLLVPRLLTHFSGNRAPCTLGPDALARLSGLPFPGNIRQLENLLHAAVSVLPPERRVVTCEDLERLLPAAQGKAEEARGPMPPLRLEDLERWAIGQALERCAGNKSRAAVLLGVSRDTLYRKLREYALD